MDDGLKESVTLALKERLSNPLWGYILLSWTGFNWQNIAKLFMSKKTVEERITDIVSQDWFYVHFLVAPLMLGVLLAIISPYLKQWLSAAHAYADEKQRKDQIKRAIDKYDDEIAIAEKKVEANKAQELAEEKEHTKVIQEQEKQKREVLDTKAIEENLKQLEKRKYEIESAIKKLEEHGEHRRYEIESSIKKLEEQGEKVQKETDFWRNRVFKVIKLVNGFNNVSNSRSLNSIKDELSSLFSDEELEIAGYVVEYQEERNKILMETISNALSLIKDIRESYNQELDYGVTTNISRHKEMDLLINELSSTLKIINKNVYMNNSKKNKNIINNIKNRAVISGTTAG
ncbi:TPA: hypothetical protein JD202_17615 [Cronobacter sakazakii]|uniref:hypothetical protein n=1 Tax=Klebsiella pneumoniae TaxID=573 RepID=UPI000F4DC9A5|nr:hypothetical protein [Klebsiella pneumoniae]AZA38059.1 hypothetical protein EB839_07645 [Klebsiella pneumoniae]HAU5499406.1 hypothetical protein [Cronobacter sakazakii]